ncbi:MAG TPA: type 1 glutamine amidotransferase domain-containing protein [Labilithrix sp.]|jgi:protease I|nr:type 1 glutamine amidotransferase domain-containing protein [Labilithrix sp.]
MKSRLVVLAAFALAIAACRDRTPPAPTLERSGTVLTSPEPAAGGVLHGKTLAILATDGFEQVELVKTQKMFADKGAKTVVVAPKAGTIQGFHQLQPGDKVTVDMSLDHADPNSFDGLVLPGGVANPDKLRLDPRALRFVRTFAESNRVVAAICHAPWLLIEAGLVRDRTLTSWPSLKTDLLNAGAVWVDRDVQYDRGIVTSRKPEDIDAFVRKTTEELLEPEHQAGKHALR